MDNWRLIRLNFGKNVAHFGEVGIGLEETSERVRSDTLFSALISTYARLYSKGDVEQLLTDFCQKTEPPFRLSSTFIYRYVVKDKKFIYYLPKPLSFPQNYPVGDDLSFTKAYKKLNYLPLEVWKQWYQTKGFEESDKTALIAHAKKDDINSSLKEAGAFNYRDTYKEARHPKVAIDRITHSTNFYHTGFIQFEHEDEEKNKNHSGLYFLLHFPESNSKLEEKLHATLNLLADEGLGGERSSGAGRFTFKWEKLPPEWEDLINFSGSNSHSLLSLLWDEVENLQNQIDLEITSYNVIPRGGWVSSSPSGIQRRRKKVRMFAEGSVFPHPPQGRLADVTPEDFNQHQIYRSGIGLSLPTNVHLFTNK
ncbi:type III-A CRISPR-associated RAMP protein Csm4 [Spirulina sp. 06S082]|uniref:type III-A CRISPR-associated RAMP protein Csm4 n=1 Tax=Spirulina sp. 06S082 TaxID=3110248 RepID=UPI003A4DB2E2